MLIKKTMTEKQIRANRANAQLSTGPISAEGKTNSRQNASRHGILARMTTIFVAGENRDDLLQFSEQLRIELKAEGLLESQLVEHLALDFLRQGRAAELEVESLYEYFERDDDNCAFAIHKPKISLELLMRYESTISKRLFRTLDQLALLQGRRLQKEKERENKEISLSKYPNVGAGNQGENGEDKGIL